MDTSNRIPGRGKKRTFNKNLTSRFPLHTRGGTPAPRRQIWKGARTARTRQLKVQPKPRKLHPLAGRGEKNGCVLLTQAERRVFLNDCSKRSAVEHQGKRGDKKKTYATTRPAVQITNKH